MALGFGATLVTADGRNGEGAGLRGQLKGAPGILGRRAQGEAGGNRGRDRGRALREEEDDADGWARAGRGGARARAGWRGADRLARLVSRVVERASRVVGHGRALLGRCVEKG